MKKFELDFHKIENPETIKKNLTEFKFGNSWISPEGDYYGFNGAKHFFAATYISIYVLGNTDDSVLKKGQFFSEQWDTYLRKLGWAELKDISWLTGGPQETTVFHRKELTQKQIDVIFDIDKVFPIKKDTDQE